MNVALLASSMPDAMNTVSPEGNANQPPSPQGIARRIIVRIVLFTMVMVAILFGSAGRLDWVMGWAFVALVVLSQVTGVVLLLAKNRELLEERSRLHKDAKAWDKLLAPLMAVGGPAVTWIVAGLDIRFGWSPPLSLTIHIVAFGMALLGMALVLWAMLSNKFFSSVVRIQQDRGHGVTSAGPYRRVRHPGYVGASAYYLATPLMLGSLWALIPAALTVCVTVLRTALEDRTLRRELDGYEEYAARVQYRLVPGIW